MKPQLQLAETKTPDGARLTLHEHDGSYAIRMNGQGLMSSAASASEVLLGAVGTARLSAKADARILIGGLGLGFTLKSVLENVPLTAMVHVVELLPAVVAWNREFLYSLNGALLDDPRVVIHVEDVFGWIARARPASYDAILLDIDNGPTAMVQDGNKHLYSQSGLSRLSDALVPGGRAVIWSAGEDPAFARRLNRAHFSVEVVRAKAHAGTRRSHILLYVADKKAE